MALSFSKLFISRQVLATVDTLFTIGASPATNLLRNGRIRFSNTTALPITITAWVVPSADSADDGDVFLPVTTIAANDFLDVDIPLASAGDKIQAQAGTATSITATPLDGFIQS